MTTNPRDRNLNACAVCAAPIGPGLLMCATHWRLVPKPLQADVVRTWGRYSRTKGKQAGQHYRAARDKAIATAAAAIPANDPPPQQRPHWSPL